MSFLSPTFAGSLGFAAKGRNLRFVRLFVSLTVLVLLAELPVCAQFGHAIEGTVKDSAGAAVSSTQITLVNVDTDVILETKTGESGFYRFPALAPGKCRVAANAPTFRVEIRENLRLGAGTNKFQGSPLEYHGNNAFAARIEFQNPDNHVTGRILPVSRRNDFTLAGSINANAFESEIWGRS
jgi:Carboxypeptidase regulatory-like domain